MVLFDLLFGAPLAGTSELFYSGGAELTDSTLVVPQGGTVSFDSHFNLFPHSKYVKYCGLKSLTLTLGAEGAYEVVFYHKSLGGKVTEVSAAKYKNNSSVHLDLSRIPADGYVYFVLKAVTETVIKSGKYESDVTPGKTKIGIVICTYKREDFVKRNLEIAMSGMAEEPVWKGRLHFFVIDNAKTLELPPSEYYTVVRNKNLGGSGGFTRGIIEVCKDKSFTHFLLMDDDILFTFELLKRTYNLAACLTDGYKNASIGGNMLILEHPTVQYECGGYFKSGRAFPQNRWLNLSVTDNLIADERESRANFNAWWYACMPVSSVEKYGLPFPFFVKGDDIEYGLRAMEHIILMNGLSVWHRSFEGKDAPAPCYYDARNHTAASAMRLKKGRLSLAAMAVYRIARKLAINDYDCAEMILRGYEDFFKGVTFFKNTDSEALNREIMQIKPSYTFKEELEEKYGAEIPEIPTGRRSTSKAKALGMVMRNFLPSCFLKKNPAVLTSIEASGNNALRNKTVIVYDCDKKQGYVCEFNGKRRRKLRHKTEKIFFKILFKYGKMYKEYNKHYKELCTEEEWNKRLELTTEEQND